MICELNILKKRTAHFDIYNQWAVSRVMGQDAHRQKRGTCCLKQRRDIYHPNGEHVQVFN